MATYYVSNSTANGGIVGNDANNGLSLATAWLTINKALTTASTAGGHIIEINPGTYAETSGSGYLNASKAYTSQTTYRKMSGSTGTVTIQAASGTTTEVAWFGPTSNQLWQNITFLGRSTNTGRVLYLQTGSTGISNLTLQNCIISTSNTASVSSGILVTDGSATANITNLTLDTCTINQTGGTQNVYGFNMARNQSGSVFDTVTLTACNVTLNGWCVAIKDTINVSITGCTLSSTSTNATGLNPYGLALGVDGTSGNNVTGSVTNNYIANIFGHSFIAGAGVSSLTVSGNTIIGGSGSLGQGAVIKECSGVTFTNNSVVGGSVNANGGIYIKGGCSNITVTDNTSVNFYSGACAMTITQGDTGNTLTSATIRRNRFCVGNAAIAMNVSNAIPSTATLVVNDNEYQYLGQGILGKIGVATSAASIAALQTQWNTAGWTGNDSRSLLTPSTINLVRRFQ